MDEKSYVSIKKEFYNFKDRLSKNITNTTISLENEECYLIEESWENELIQYFDKYNNIIINNKKIDKNKIDFLNYLPENAPVFINDFSSVFKCLKNNKKMKLISKNIIESIYEEDDLKENNIIKYYSGYYKLIIEYKGNNENKDNKALLIINPFNKNNIKKTAYIISIKDEDKQILYSDLLSEMDFDEIYKKYQKNIINFEKYMNVLKLLINIYYYEKSLLGNKEKIYKENEDVYLINPNWIDKLKNHYDFNNFVKNFNELKVENNNRINYNNLYKYLYSILDYKNNINFIKKEIFNDFKNINPENNNYKGLIDFYSNCYIVNSEIMNLIKSIFSYNKIYIKKKNIFIKNNNIYLLYNKNIIIGDINEKLIFNPKYILAYKDSNFLNSAKPKIFSYKIEDYLNSKLRIPNRNNYDNYEYGTFINLLNKDNSMTFRIYKRVKPTNSFSGKRKVNNNKSFDNIKTFFGRRNSAEKNTFFAKTLSKYTYKFQKIKNNSLNNIKNINIINNKGFDINQNELQNKIDNLNKKITQYEKEYELIIKENKNIKKQLNKANKIITELEDRINVKNNEIILLKKKNEKQDNEIKKLFSKINNYKHRENSLNIKEKEIKRKIASLEDKTNNINKNKNKNDKKILEENIKTLIQENITLIGKNKELKKAIEEMQNPYKLVGLNNIGAACFMNATLQCLSQTKDLTRYFLDKNNEEKIINNNIAIKNKNNFQLSPVFLELIKRLWDRNGPESISPINFMNTIENMNPLFKKGQAGDSKDFIIFILEQLHIELKKSVKKNNGNNKKSKQLNQYDKKNAFNYFSVEFQKESSIISDLFFGFNEKTYECINCKNKNKSKGLNNPICYNYGIFNCIIFPLEEVKKMKKNSYKNNININQNNIVSLNECFLYNQKTDYFTRNNKNYCNICKQLYDSFYTCKIFKSPNILILILNRGKGNIYNIKLDFNENIDITQFVIEKDSPRIIYSLYGVITHIGKSGPNAHFVASCKSTIDNKWYRFNDSLINPITDVQKEVIEFGTPYILFYQKNNN